MPLADTTLVFTRGSAPASRLDELARDIVAELADPASAASRDAERAGFDPADLVGTDITVREGEQGAEPILTTIIVGIAVAAGSKIAESLWTDVIWPRIRRRLGADALGDPKADPKADPEPVPDGTS